MPLNRQDIELTLYLVGYDQDDAQTNLPFDSYDSAQSFALDNPGMKVYSVTAAVDFSTIEEVPE